MGRKLKRVPLDFAWPLKETWIGYINPHYSEASNCPDCAGTGLTPEAKHISDQWYGSAPFDPVAYGATPLTVDHPAIVAFAERQCERNSSYYGTGQYYVDLEARRLFNHFRGQWCHHLIQADVDALVAADRLYDFTRRPRTPEQEATLAEDGGYWLAEQNGYTPTADEVNAWSIGGIGHDAINSGACLRARCAREGVTLWCARCAGEGTVWTSEEAKATCEAWEETEPPTGEGYQLWQDTSEDSPVSPVFAMLEELCAWCADNATTFGSERATAEKWRSMLDANFVCHQEGNNIFL